MLTFLASAHLSKGVESIYVAEVPMGKILQSLVIGWLCREPVERTYSLMWTLNRGTDTSPSQSFLFHSHQHFCHHSIAFVRVFSLYPSLLHWLWFQASETVITDTEQFNCCYFNLDVGRQKSWGIIFPREKEQQEGTLLGVQVGGPIFLLSMNYIYNWQFKSLSNIM
jgi:hypothetical protein